MAFNLDQPARNENNLFGSFIYGGADPPAPQRDCAESQSQQGERKMARDNFNPARAENIAAAGLRHSRASWKMAWAPFCVPFTEMACSRRLEAEVLIRVGGREGEAQIPIGQRRSVGDEGPTDGRIQIGGGVKP